MFSFQARLPWLLVIIGLTLYFLGFPMQFTSTVPSKLASGNTPVQLQKITHFSGQDMISETADPVPNRARVIFETLAGMVCSLAGIAISFKHRRYEHLSDSIPTSKDYLVVYMHDRDGKKRRPLFSCNGRP
ncbi:MAG: hypothetical protein GX626_05135 [Spirochaetales bacterium]|jgi:hypothetical protein|nr:hypothetical protein [Spirochaetales bacterium]